MVEKTTLKLIEQLDEWNKELRRTELEIIQLKYNLKTNITKKDSLKKKIKDLTKRIREPK